MARRDENDEGESQDEEDERGDEKPFSCSICTTANFKKFNMPMLTQFILHHTNQACQRDSITVCQTVISEKNLVLRMRGKCKKWIGNQFGYRIITICEVINDTICYPLPQTRL